MPRREVNALDPDLVLITGDLFDGVNGKYEAFIAPLNRLRAEHGVFFVTGNHEHYVGVDYGLNRIGDMQVYTTCGVGTWGPPLRSPIRPEIVLIRPVRK